MSTDITIRRLGPHDAHAWARVRREALEMHPLAFGASLPGDPKLLIEIANERLTLSDDTATFGAFIDNVLIGIIGILREQNAKERHKALIVGMFVCSGNRRTGVGEKLLGTAIQHARAWDGVEQVQLVVNDVAIEAKRLYEKAGFQAWGIESQSLQWEGRYTDAIHMILDLRKLK